MHKMKWILLSLMLSACSLALSGCQGYDPCGAFPGLCA